MKKKLYLNAITILLLGLILVGCNGQTNDIVKDENLKEPISRTEFLMDTVMTITIYDRFDQEILDKAFNRLKEIENRMSVTIEDSDISKINKNSGISPVTVNEDTYFVIKLAKKYAEMSNGAYEPTIGPLVDLWNIKSEEKSRGYIPKEDIINEKIQYVNYEELELLSDEKVFLKRQGMKINLGGVVKGYAADEVKKILEDNGVKSAIINLGGNIYALGERIDGSHWKIGIQNPLEVTGHYLGIAQIKNKSIVTSGDYERYFDYNNKRYHHIIDSKTGYPTDNELSGVSIISDKSIDGDALSTTFFVLGLDEGMKLANSLDSVEAVFITKSKELYLTQGLKDMFKIRDESLGFTIKEY